MFSRMTLCGTVGCCAVCCRVCIDIMEEINVSILKIEKWAKLRSAEKVVNFYQNTRRHILEDMIFNDEMESVERSFCFFRYSVQDFAYLSEGNEKIIELK
jgi:hypothetical protein